MKQTTSKALTEVWEAKRIVGEETAHLHGADYFRYLRAEVARSFPGIAHRKASTTHVAENSPTYGETN